MAYNFRSAKKPIEFSFGPENDSPIFGIQSSGVPPLLVEIGNKNEFLMSEESHECHESQEDIQELTERSESEVDF